MANTLIPFPAHRVQRAAEITLLLASSRRRLSKPVTWRDRPDPPEPLGNMVQRLALRNPSAVLVLESIVAEMLQILEQINP